MKSLVFLCVVFLIFVTPLFSQTDWTKHSGNPLLEVGAPGSWDDVAIVHSSVYFDGTTYHMWYSGFDGINVRIGYATSPDGIDWTKHPDNPVVDIGPPGSWDWERAYLSTVVIINSTYHMWYTGTYASNERIGHATSPDGITWDKDTLNPVIDIGPPGSWYDVHVGTGFVMLEEDTLHLWFMGSDGSYFRIGHATSTVGDTSWTFNPITPVLNIGSWDNPRVQSPSVVYNSVRSEYYMLYAGRDLFTWEIGYASSPNLNGPWTKPTNEPIFTKGGPGTWDRQFVGFPYVIFDSANNICKMWYTGGDIPWSGSIGYATSPIELPDTLHVPAVYSTIQAAIDAANHSDIVLVADGTYLENINYKGKAITVASHFLIDGNESHIENTIIDGSQPIDPDFGSVVLFISGEDTNSVLCGFTITGGTGTYSPYPGRLGGGIGFVNSGAQIKNNIIEFNTLDNTPLAYGGGIYTDYSNNSNIIIKNNIIQNNTCNGTDYACGGGIKITTNGYALISNNKILQNTVSAGIEATGGGIECFGPINEVYIVNNYIKGNTVQTNYNGGGGIDIYDCTTNTPVLENNIIVGNYSNLYGGGVEVDLDLDERLKPGGSKTLNTTESDNLLTPVFFANNTIINNTAGVSGGGIYTHDMTSNIMNTILWGNTAPADSQIAGTVNVVYSDVEGGWTGEGNINVNPSFSDTLFHLADSSLCIGAGIESIDIGGTLYYCPPFCYYGSPRPNPPGSMPDIGACESPLAVSGIVDDFSQIPEEYSLLQNFPNPFNPTTTIVYGLRERTIVELKVYDVLGSEIEEIVNGEQDAGYYEIEFNARRLASGIYFYRLQAGNFIETKKMILMK